MIFERIEIENFGVFKGQQTINLAPKSPAKPIILIGGLNGGGKTTLLDALQLVLYGRMARCSNRGSLAYDEFIRRSVHRGIAGTDPVALELRFRRLLQGEEQTYIVRRWWDLGSEAPVEHLKVSVNGAFDPALTDTWTEQVEAILPQGLSALFFFDGEKIEELATPKSAATVLATAINALLGLEIVDRLSTDLSVLNRRKLAETRTDNERLEIQSTEAEVRALEKMIEEAETARASAQTSFDRSGRELADAEGRYHREGGSLLERQQSLTTELNEARTRLEAGKAEFWQQAAGAAPLLLVTEQLQAIVIQAEREHEHRHAQIMVDTLARRDEKILGQFKKDKAAQPLVRQLEKLLVEDRQRRTPKAGFKAYLGIDDSARAHVALLVDTVLPAVKKRERELSADIEKMTVAVTNLERKQAAIPEKETVGTAARLVTDRQHAVQQDRIKLELADAKLAQLRRELEHKQNVLVRMLEKDVGGKIKHLDDQRLLAHSARVRKTLETFRETIVRRHVSRIEHLVLECFQRLLHKDSLVTELRIDPQNYALTLFGGDRLPLLPERLSAGERQLLAVALLWGLARAAGRALPTIIDTPLGRLDAQHRQHLIERYFPFASHQVVLLATDSEINAAYHTKLAPAITREYTLVHNGAERRTQVEEGFFNS